MNRRAALADSAQAYAESRRDLIAELNADLPIGREAPGFYGRAIGDCETAIVRIANTLEHYAQADSEYSRRVRQLCDEGMSNGDAQAIADHEGLSDLPDDVAGGAA
jgi:aromatic ring hydroxylase